MSHLERSGTLECSNRNTQGTLQGRSGNTGGTVVLLGACWTLNYEVTFSKVIYNASFRRSYFDIIKMNVHNGAVAIEPGILDPSLATRVSIAVIS